MLTNLPLWKVVVQVVGVGGLLLFWSLRPDPSRRILLLGVLAQTLYGVLQDQVSARLSPEYFTVAHPRIEGLDDPTLLGITWGFLGSWWGGALLGAAAALTARVGGRPKLGASDLLLPVAAVLMLQAAVTAWWGWQATAEAATPGFTLIEPLASHIAPERHANCFIVSRMHQGTYLSAVAGSLLLCLGIAAWRARLARRLPQATTATTTVPDAPRPGPKGESNGK